jgi:hypothetical protein
MLMLEGARLATNPDTGLIEVIYPTITEDWTDLYDMGHVAQLSHALTSLLDAACDDRDESVHYLDRAINMPEFSQLAAKSFTQALSKRSPLDDDTKFKRNEISILTLLPPPTESAAYDSYCRTTHATEIDHMVNQGEKQSTRVGTEIFNGGNQNHPDDVVAAIANMDVMYQLKYGFDTTDETSMPLIVVLLRQLADLYCTRNFRKWYKKVSASAPWISHTLITQVHSLLSKVANIANNPTNKRQFRAGRPLHPEVYNDVANEFKRIKDNTLATISSSSLGSLFTSAPSSYVAPREPNPRRQRDPSDRPGNLNNNAGGDRINKSASTRGWLTNNTNGYVLIRGLAFCSSHACDGTACRTRDCPRPHKSYPRDFTQAEQLVICNHIKATPGLMFERGVPLPHFMTGCGGNPSRPPLAPPRTGTPRQVTPQPAAAPAAAPPAATPVTPGK